MDGQTHSVALFSLCYLAQSIVLSPYNSPRLASLVYGDAELQVFTEQTQKANPLFQEQQVCAVGWL